jgi:hypothetical protein
VVDLHGVEAVIDKDPRSLSVLCRRSDGTQGLGRALNALEEVDRERGRTRSRYVLEDVASSVS